MRRLVVAVSGLDGSGKSSTIGALVEALQSDGHQVRVVHQFDNLVARTVRTLRPRSGAPRTRASKEGDSSTSRERPVSAVRAVLGHLVVIALIVRFLVHRSLLSPGVLLLDRFLQDDLERLVRSRLMSMSSALAWARRAPRPTMLVVLSPPISVSFARQVSPDMSEAQYVQKAQRMARLWAAAEAGGTSVLRLDTSVLGVREVRAQAMAALAGLRS